MCWLIVDSRLVNRWVDLTLLCACWLLFVTLITRSISYHYHISCLTLLWCFTTLYVCALVTSCKAQILISTVTVTNNLRHVMNAFSPSRTPLFITTPPSPPPPSDKWGVWCFSHRKMVIMLSVDDPSVFPWSNAWWSVGNCSSARIEVSEFYVLCLIRINF